MNPGILGLLSKGACRTFSVHFWGSCLSHLPAVTVMAAFLELHSPLLPEHGSGLRLACHPLLIPPIV